MTQWGLDTLFNPAKRHMDEEKQRLQSTREEVGDASGGRRIDLESGKVTIRRSPKADTGDGVTDAQSAADADTDTDAPTGAPSDAANAGMTAAARDARDADGSAGDADGADEATRD